MGVHLFVRDRSTGCCHSVSSEVSKRSALIILTVNPLKSEFRLEFATTSNHCSEQLLRVRGSVRWLLQSLLDTQISKPY